MEASFKSFILAFRETSNRQSRSWSEWRNTSCVHDSEGCDRDANGGVFRVFMMVKICGCDDCDFLIFR